MAFVLRAIDRTRVSNSIAEQLVEGIRSGAYATGSPLPSERALSEQLSVSRGSVREAIRMLEHAGVVEVRNGIGTFVTAEASSSVLQLRVRAAVLGDVSPLDLIVTRRALEPLCAGLAACHRTDQQLAALRDSVVRQTAAVEAGHDTQQIDLEFHRLLATATHNPVLEMLVHRLAALMEQATWRELKGAARGGHAAAFLKQHELVLAAVEAGSEHGATVRMVEHLAAVESALVDLLNR